MIPAIFGVLIKNTQIIPAIETRIETEMETHTRLAFNCALRPDEESAEPIASSKPREMATIGVRTMPKIPPTRVNF